MERTAHTATDSRDVWTLTDGHAGNVRQAAALAAALGHNVARDWLLRPHAPWGWVAPRKLAGCTRAFGREFSAALRAPSALAIGCGRQAALATRLLRERGSKAVQILDPRIGTGHWDLVIAPEHDGLHGDNVITLLGSLHPVDDAWLAQAREDFSVLSPLPQPRIALLLGGPSKHVDLDATAFATRLAQLEAVLLREGGSLMLTTSRRTPAAWREQVRQRFAAVPGVRWFGAPGASGDDDNPYPGMLAWADRIVCTPDSVNMISEACATHAPVFVIDPASTRGRLRSYHDSLLALGRAQALDDTLAPFTMAPLRETARVAAEVRQRLGL